MWRCGRALRFWENEWLSRLGNGHGCPIGKMRVVYAVGDPSVKNRGAECVYSPE